MLSDIEAVQIDIFHSRYGFIQQKYSSLITSKSKVSLLESNLNCLFPLIWAEFSEIQHGTASPIILFWMWESLNVI